MISPHIKKQLEEAGFSKLPTLDVLIHECNLRAVSIFRTESGDGWVIQDIDSNMNIGADSIEDCFAILWLRNTIESTQKMEL